MQSLLKDFIDLLVGDFDNLEQYNQIHPQNNKFPFAKHKNTIINHKIKNLPSDFDGIFMLEESYYTINSQQQSLPHLFLFELKKEQVILNSYEIPEGFDKKTFNYQNVKELDYTKLVLSPKFTPAIYQKKNDQWEGGSISQFSPQVTFKLWECFSKDSLEVAEVMEANGKKIFGYEVPIIYKRIINQ